MSAIPDDPVLLFRLLVQGGEGIVNQIVSSTNQVKGKRKGSRNIKKTIELLDELVTDANVNSIRSRILSSSILTEDQQDEIMEIARQNNGSYEKFIERGDELLRALQTKGTKLRPTLSRLLESEDFEEQQEIFSAISDTISADKLQNLEDRRKLVQIFEKLKNEAPELTNYDAIEKRIRAAWKKRGYSWPKLSEKLVGGPSYQVETVTFAKINDFFEKLLYIRSKGSPGKAVSSILPKIGSKNRSLSYSFDEKSRKLNPFMKIIIERGGEIGLERTIVDILSSDTGNILTKDAYLKSLKQLRKKDNNDEFEYPEFRKYKTYNDLPSDEKKKFDAMFSDVTQVFVLQRNEDTEDMFYALIDESDETKELAQAIFFPGSSDLENIDLDEFDFIKLDYTEYLKRKGILADFIKEINPELHSELFTENGLKDELLIKTEMKDVIKDVILSPTELISILQEITSLNYRSGIDGAITPKYILAIAIKTIKYYEDSDYTKNFIASIKKLASTEEGSSSGGSRSEPLGNTPEQIANDVVKKLTSIIQTIPNKFEEKLNDLVTNPESYTSVFDLNIDDLLKNSKLISEVANNG